MKKHKIKIISGLIIVIILATAYLCGGIDSATENVVSETTVEQTPIPTTDEIISESETIELNTDVQTPKDKTESVTETRTAETFDKEQQETEVFIEEHTCNLSVRCDTILNNMSSLDKAKSDIIPKDGTIFAGHDVVFYEGESVFNVIVREMKRNKIHIEYEMSPIYETAYIKGIANIYEFDCGDLSGWLYKVNGQVPNVGCSLYYLNDGDVVELVYTCEMGKDLE